MDTLLKIHDHSHAYFQYTGERQTAVKELQRLRQQKWFQFHMIYYNKLLASFDPFVQHYIQYNGVFHAHHLPAHVYDQPKAHDSTLSVRKLKLDQDTFKHMQIPEDYLLYLKNMSIDEKRERIRRREAARNDTLKEMKYLSYRFSPKEHEYCHAVGWSEETKDALD
jgi:hypothetical protein